MELIIKKFKLRKANEFEYHIKDGRKIIEKIYKLTNGWYACCVIFDEFEDALSYWKNLTLRTCLVFGNQNAEYSIQIERK